MRESLWAAVSRAALACLTLLIALLVGPSSASTARTEAAKPMIWGVVGQPFLAYPGIDWGKQLDLVRELGATQYRFALRPDGSVSNLETLLSLASQRGVTLLPILTADVNFDQQTPEQIYRISREHAVTMATRFRGKFPVWELGNENEIYALLKPCENFWDGRQYPCEWGLSSGVAWGDYHMGRWAKVSAYLKGMSDGVGVGDPAARRAIGTGGWGRVGPFDLLQRDGVAWEISVWHEYRRDLAAGPNDEFFARMAAHGKPIWITEFSVGEGEKGLDPQRQAYDYTARIVMYRRMARLYNIEAAFVYELCDQPYWGDQTGESRMGLIRLEQRYFGGWRVGEKKPAFFAVQAEFRESSGPQRPR